MVTIPDTVRWRARVLSAHRHAVSAGACWFLGMLLLVAGSTAAAQGAVMIGAMVLIAGLATGIGCGRADELNAPATAGAFRDGPARRHTPRKGHRSAPEVPPIFSGLAAR
jgi:hypothetical protein